MIRSSGPLSSGLFVASEPLQLAVPVDGVLVAHRQCVDGAVRNGPVFEPGHVFPNPVCLAALTAWLGMSADHFMRSESVAKFGAPSPLADLVDHPP